MKAHTFEEKKNIFQNILREINDVGLVRITTKEIIERFKEKGCFLKSDQFENLQIRKILKQHDVLSCKLSKEEKQEYFPKFIKYLLEEKISSITNKKLISLMKEKYEVTLRETEIVKLGLRELLKENGISTVKEVLINKKKIIDKTLTDVIDNNIKITSVTQLHKIAQKYGQISRSTLDNNLDYIQSKIKIENIKSTKRLKALNITDKEIMIETAKHYMKKNIYKLTASELRKYTNSNYRTVDIEIVKSYKSFLKDNYDIEIISIDNIQENKNYHVEEVLHYFSNNKLPYKVEEVDSVDNIQKVNSIKNDVFYIDKKLEEKLENYWKIYLDIYIQWLSQERINVQNSLLNNNNTLKIDTEKKQVITLSHKKLNINNISFVQLVQLSMLTSKSANKSYGIHMQNMYIGFLLYLYAINQIVMPFSYVYDVCYSEKKVQKELPYFIKSHNANRQLFQAIKEKRLNIKDNKYKRIFQFFLLTLPVNYPVEAIKYSDLYEIKIRSEHDFKRVSEILNTLGASIEFDKPQYIYVDNYHKYIKKEKYNSLIKIFNEAMNRACKLGSYSREKNVYKNWSTQYAYFFDFIEENYANRVITEDFLYRLFNFPDEKNILTYQEFIQNQRLSSNTKDGRFTPLIVAFAENSKYISIRNLKDKKPVFENTSIDTNIRQKRAPITNPNALIKIEDILRNRPPKSNYHKILNIDEQFTGWWKHYHYVAPFEPLILLAHLYIPARGINFRLADCDSFLVKNDKGDTTGYHFTHDKKKKRKTPYIAPNIWGDNLELLEKLTQYVKIHFPYLKRIKYDKQNPQGILPLFPNAKGNSFYSEEQHMKYWKRVLLKAQIEFNNEENEENILLIFPVSNIAIPSKPEDVDILSQGDMEKFQVRYDLHSLRHTGATKYANAGMPMGLVALLTGHIDMNVLQSVYVELDIQKMIEMWNDLENVDIGNGTLAEAGRKLINNIEATAKEFLNEKSPEKLLIFLEERNFVSIGSYLNKTELTLYELEDFSKTDPVFWSFRRNGICTSAQCPQGLENRCSLCPYFMTSPVYIHEIAMHINLQNFRLAKYGNLIIENRKKGNPGDNENIRKSAQIEMEEMLGWIKILQALDEVRLMLDKNVVIANNDNKNLTVQDTKEKSVFSLASIVNSDHSLLKLVYESLELKEFGHESFQDAAEKLVGKIIRYAARNSCFEEIDGIDKYQILEWFRPVYQNILSLEKDNRQKNKLEHILNLLSDKSSANLIDLKETTLLENKEEK